MDERVPKRPWWKRKRWWAALPVWAAACYFAGFVPACWVLTGFDPLTGVAADAVRRAYRPAASALMAAPPWVQRTAEDAVNAGLPPGATFRIHPYSIVVSYSTHPVYGGAVVRFW